MTRDTQVWILVGGFSLLLLLLVACGDITAEEPLVTQSPDQSEELVETSAEIDFPLTLGNTWVYSGTFYQGSNPSTVLTATYIVTESVVDILHSDLDTYTIFQIAREEELIFCPTEWQSRPDNWCDRLAIPDPAYYWYIIEGTTLYRQDRLESYRLLERGIRELLFPLEEGKQWYLNHKMAQTYPNYEVDSMLRKVVATRPRTVPAGNFEGCFQLQTIVGGETSLLDYCPNVGIVERAYIHHGTPFGTHETLIKYVFPQ